MQKQTDVYRKRRPMVVLAGLVLIWIGFNRISHHVLYGELSEHVSTAVAYDESYDDEYVYSQAILSEDINAYLGEMDITTPIFLQTNEEWADRSYGNDGSQTLAENGCAIASLAMVQSYLEGYPISPLEVLNWAGDHYYVDGQGTDWRIFSDFADANGYNYYDLGTDLASVEAYLQQNHPVIVSVTPGEFTDGGHIMVLGGMMDDQVFVLDPNDDPEKSHYAIYYTLDEIADQSLRFWTFS